MENNHANSLRGQPKPLPDQNVRLSVCLHLAARQVYNKHIFPSRRSGRSVNLTTPFQSTSLNCVKMYPLCHLYAFMSNTQDTRTLTVPTPRFTAQWLCPYLKSRLAHSRFPRHFSGNVENGSRDRVVGTVTKLRAGLARNRGSTLGRGNRFSSPTKSPNQLYGPTGFLPIQWVPGTPSPKATHSSPSTFNNEWNYTSTSTGFHTVHREYFKFYLKNDETVSKSKSRPFIRTS